jgi:multidrug resistance efflux pump
MMSRQRGYRWLLVSAAMLAVAGTGAGTWHGFQAGGAADATPAPEEGPEPVVCFGYVDVEPGLTRLSVARSGRVIEVPVVEGQSVVAGAGLLRLDSEPARQLVRQVQADLATARQQREEARRLPDHQRARLAGQRAAVVAARGRRDAAWHQHERLRRMLANELCTQEEVQTTAAEVRALEASVRAEMERLADLEVIDASLPAARAEALVEAKKAQLEQAEYALRECTLKAPEGGTVLRVLVAPGEVLAEKGAQPAFYFCPDRPRIVRADVTQEKAARLASGQSVLLEDDGDPSLHWRGTVRRVSDWYTRRRSIMHDPLEAQDVRTVECIIEPESAARLRIGQKLRVTIASVGQVF